MRLPAISHTRPGVHYIWRGPSVLILDSRGEAGSQSLTGFYFRETRYLSGLRLEIEGEQPFVCSVSEAAPYELEFSHIYPPVVAGGGGGSGSGGIASGEESPEAEKSTSRVGRWGAPSQM
jgi:hypothetical protein